MSIPSYKQVHIKSDKKELVFDQLNQHQFGQVPYIFSINHLCDQNLVIHSLETYFIKNQISFYPYPIYIISSLENYRGPLLLRKSIHHCPSFYNQKIKQLNAKESKILQKIHLKQKNLQNIRAEDYKTYLNEYARYHKKLNHLYNEQLFYEGLIEKLESYYEQKDKK